MKSLLDDLSFALCGVCGGEHDNNWGYAPDEKSRIMWACDECMPIASHVYGVSPMAKKKYEQQARENAISAMGVLMMEWEKTDFAAMEMEEALAVFEAALKAYQKTLREALANHAPPF